MQENLVWFFLSTVIFNLTFLVVLLVIADLSRILGEAIKKRPLYKLIYVACICLITSQVMHFFGKDLRIYAYAFDVAGLILGSGVTYYYWKWLPGDLSRG